MINVNRHIAGLNYNQQKIIKYLEYSADTANHNIDELNLLILEMKQIIDDNKLEIKQLRDIVDPARKDWTDLYDF